jgi:hypothetical protein
LDLTIARIKSATVVSLLAVVSAASLSFAQNAGDKPGTASNEKKIEASEEYRLGAGNRSVFGDTLGGHWTVISSVQFSQSFDDNVFLASAFRLSDTISKYSGRVTLAYRGKHARFEANYLPEYNMNFRYDTMSYAAHVYSQSLTYQSGPRTEFHWNFGCSFSPGRGGLPSSLLNFGGYQVPVNSLEDLDPGTNILNGNTSVGVSHNLSARSRLTLDLNSASTKFLQRKSTGLPTTNQGQTYSGGINLGWSYEINPGRSFGFSVADNYLGVLSPDTHQHSQNVQATFGQKLRGNFNLSVSVGPSFTERQGSNQVDVGTAYNATLSREGKRIGYNLTAAKVFQAGLQVQSLSSDTFAFNAHRAFGRRWTSSIGVAYSRSQDQSGISSSENVSGTGQIRYQLTHQISASVNYSHLRQDALASSSVAIRNVDRNSVSIGLVYDIGVIAKR